jgi:hypothetical protein
MEPYYLSDPVKQHGNVRREVSIAASRCPLETASVNPRSQLRIALQSVDRRATRTAKATLNESDNELRRQPHVIHNAMRIAQQSRSSTVQAQPHIGGRDVIQVKALYKSRGKFKYPSVQDFPAPNLTRYISTQVDAETKDIDSTYAAK